jgi:hypothetical protein
VTTSGGGHAASRGVTPATSPSQNARKVTARRR